MRYDPSVGPDPAEWLQLDDAERTLAVRQYHKKARLHSGNAEVHAIVHAAVETQLAAGHPEAQAAYSRLSRELDRHDVIHAIGSVLAEELFDVMKQGRAHDPARYARKLAALTAEKWRGSR